MRREQNVAHRLNFGNEKHGLDGEDGTARLTALVFGSSILILGTVDATGISPQQFRVHIAMANSNATNASHLCREEGRRTAAQRFRIYRHTRNQG